MGNLITSIGDVVKKIASTVMPSLKPQEPPKPEYILDEKLRGKALEYVQKNFKKFSNRAGLEEIWTNAEKHYNLIDTDIYYDTDSEVFIPEMREGIDTGCDLEDEALFPSDDFFDWKGIGGPADDKNADVIKRTIKYQLSSNVMNFRAKMRKFNLQKRKLGITAAKVFWKLEKKRRKVFNPLTQKWSWQYVPVYDNPDFENKNVRNLFWDIFANDWDDLRCIIDLYTKDYTYLKSNEKSVTNPEGIYYFVDEILKDAPVKINEGQEKQSNKDFLSDLIGVDDKFTEQDGDDNKTKKYTLYECWCNFDINGDGLEEECVITTIDNKTVIRLEENPDNMQIKPYIFQAWEEITGTNVGMGGGKLTESLQIALNDFSRQTLDNITGIINNMWLVDKDAEVSDLELKNRQNGVIHYSPISPEPVKPLPKPAIVNEGLQGVAMMKDEIKRALKAPVSLQGLPGRINTTATEYERQFTSASKAVLAKVKETEDEVVKEVLWRVFQLDIQFMTRNDFIRIVGEEAVNSTIGKGGFENLSGDYNITPLGLTQMENKVVHTQQLINFMNISAGLPPGIANIDFEIILKKIWQSFGYRDDSEIFIKTPKQELINPNDENILMEQGEKIDPNPRDNHILHITVHNQGAKNEIKAEHIQKHYQILQFMTAQMGQKGNPIPPQEMQRKSPEENQSSIISKQASEQKWS